jgi:hypothetical protein
MTGCRGESWGDEGWETAAQIFVLAGLDPAPHALGRSGQRRGYADQVPAKRPKIVARAPDTSSFCMRHGAQR